MNNYYVNKIAQPNGDHEVHKDSCDRMPASHNALYLGAFASCMEAVRKAKGIYPSADGCFHCIPACHTR